MFIAVQNGACTKSKVWFYTVEKIISRKKNDLKKAVSCGSISQSPWFHPIFPSHVAPRCVSSKKVARTSWHVFIQQWKNARLISSISKACTTSELCWKQGDAIVWEQMWHLLLLLHKHVLSALPACTERGYELQQNGYKQLSESDTRSMWEWTWGPAVWTQRIYQKHMGMIHWQDAHRHNMHLHMQIANRTQFLNPIFKQISQFDIRSAFPFSPHLFGSLCVLLDLRSIKIVLNVLCAHVCQCFKSQGLKASKSLSGG